MILTKQFVTENGQFELTLQTSKNNVYNIAYLTPFNDGKYLESADNEDWIFNDLVFVLKRNSEEFCTNYISVHLGVPDTKDKHHKQLITILEAGKKWYNKPAEELKENNLVKARRYNQGKLSYSLLDFEAVEEIIKVLEYGAFKYSILESPDDVKIQKSGKDFIDIYGYENGLEKAKHWNLISSGKDNWKNKIEIMDILDSAMRHLTARIKGEKIDSESNLRHLAHLGANVIFALYHELKDK